MFEYQAKIVSVYDGDTITVDIDLGLKTWIRGEKIRIFGINAPEVKGPQRVAGLASRDFLRSKLPEGKLVTINTIKDKQGKYGRYLARVDVDGVDVATLLVAEGHAQIYDY